ncbi:MAG: serine/threonine-protein kinase [Bacteroidota bacterium]
MSELNWQKLKEIFNEALALSPDKRHALLEGLPDQQMKAEVESLLASYNENPAFLENAVHTSALKAVELVDPQAATGLVLGAYRVVRELGRGGMGMVYLAERVDGAFEHHVAIKVGKQDAYNPEYVERLKHERQILASLAHPHIAKLLDGGVTADGRPYFAMEYVEDGLPIDTFCAQEGYDVVQKLQLFRSICAAIAYAHRQLVVHRDLKPSNILVSPEGQVKLLDFGLAKLLDDKAGSIGPQTRTGMQLMTLEYASPEQVRGVPVSTATDVYSLGVVLYKLLAGKRPYDVRHLSPTQIERIICTQEPMRPSEMARDVATGKEKIAADLDNIVMKALRKEPERRYGSVELLREDIDRFLQQLPVSARPATARYRLSKFVNRHRWGVGAAIVFAFALLGGVVSTSYQAQRAAVAQQKAEERTDAVRAMANTLLFDIHDAIRDLPGATPARRLLVKNAEQYLNMLGQAFPEDPGLQAELAEAYNRVGEIYGDPHFPNLGNLAEAGTYYGRALELRESLQEQGDDEHADTHALALAKARLAVVKSWGGENEEAIVLSSAALASLGQQYQNEPNDVILHDIGRIRSELGWWLVFSGDIPEAKEILEKAIDELESLSQTKAGHVDFEIDLWRAYNYAVDAYRWSGAPAYALEVLEAKACPRLAALGQKLALNPRLQSCYATCLSKMGGLYNAMGDEAKNIQYLEQALTIAKGMEASDTTNVLGKQTVGALLSALGNAHQESGDVEKTTGYFERAINLRREIYQLDETHGEAGNALGNSLRSSCLFYATNAKFDLALARCAGAVEVFEKVIAVDSLNGIWQSNLIESYLVTADVHKAAAEQRSGAFALHLQQASEEYAKGIALIDLLAGEGRAFEWPAKLDSLRALHRLVRDELDRAKKD